MLDIKACSILLLALAVPTQASLMPQQGAGTDNQPSKLDGANTTLGADVSYQEMLHTPDKRPDSKHSFQLFDNGLHGDSYVPSENYITPADAADATVDRPGENRRRGLGSSWSMNTASKDTSRDLTFMSLLALGLAGVRILMRRKDDSGK